MQRGRTKQNTQSMMRGRHNKIIVEEHMRRGHTQRIREEETKRVREQERERGKEANENKREREWGGKMMKESEGM